MAYLVSMKHFALTLANKSALCFPPNLADLECACLLGLLRASNKVAGSSKPRKYRAVGLSALQTDLFSLLTCS